jgi:hypothetical protein
LRCWCWRFVFEEAFIVTQLNDGAILLVRKEIVVQVKIQIPLVLLGSFCFGLYHMRARSLIYGLRRFNLLARDHAEKVFRLL